MKRPLCLICFVFFLAILCLVQGRNLSEEIDATKLPKEFCGTVYQIQHKDGQVLVYLSAVAENTQRVKMTDLSQTSEKVESSRRVICYFDEKNIPSKLAIGNWIRVQGKPRAFLHATNDGQFDQADYYAVMEVDCAMTGCEGVIVDAHVDVLGQGLYRVRRHLSGIIDQCMEKEHGAVLKAMLLGDKTEVDSDTKSLYQRNGISHIMAISGLHISMLGMAFYKTLRRMLDFVTWKGEKVLSTVVSILFVYLYGRMTGNSASAIRSMVMFGMFLVAELLIRTYDILTAMAVSALVLLLRQPYYVTQCGFLLSFGAIMGIGLVADTLAGCFDGKKKLCQSLQASLAISIVTLPVQLYYFYTFPTYSVFLNLIVIPMMSVLMVFGVAGLLAGLLCLPLARLLFCPVEWILRFYEWICHIFDGLWFSHPILGRPSKVQMVAYYLIMCGVVCLHWRRMARMKPGRGKDRGSEKSAWINLGFYALAICMLCVRVRLHNQCTMLDVGQGNCFVMEQKSGRTILYDGGSSDVSQVGTYRIIPYLKSHSVSSVDYIFVSHSDKDHICGIEELLADTQPGSIQIKCLILSTLAKDDDGFDKMRELAAAKGTRILYMAAGDELAVDNSDMVFSCLYPSGKEGTLDSNDQSLTILMTCDGVRTLFVGDLTSTKELEAVADCDILQVGHHGSKYSTSEAMLATSTPKLALVSAGIDNSYGHPHKETLRRLQEYISEAYIYRTDVDGQVTLTFDGAAVKVKTFRKERQGQP